MGDPPDRMVEIAAMVNSSRLATLYPYQSDHLSKIGRSLVSFCWMVIEAYVKTRY